MVWEYHRGVDSYTDVAKKNKTSWKAQVVGGRQRVRTGWNSKEDEKLRRGIVRVRESVEKSIAWNTA